MHAFCSFIHCGKEDLMHSSLKSIKSHYVLLIDRERVIAKNNRKEELSVHLPVLDISVGLWSEEAIEVCSVFLYPVFNYERQ